MALIEIDGLPIINGDFPWQTVKRTRWYWKISIGLFFKGKSTHQMHENWEKTSMSWKHPAIVNGHATGT
jgi:hypothetical protein